MLTLNKRRRVNIMLDVGLIARLNELIPSGERSNVINEALEEKIIKLGRRKASDFMEEIRKKIKHKTSNKKIYAEIRHGRK